MTGQVRTAMYRAEIRAGDLERAICIAHGQLRCGRIADARQTLENGLPELRAATRLPQISHQPPRGAA